MYNDESVNEILGPWAIVRDDSRLGRRGPLPRRQVLDFAIEAMIFVVGPCLAWSRKHLTLATANQVDLALKVAPEVCVLVK